MHQQSLFCGEDNAFDPNGEMELSDVAMYYIGEAYGTCPAIAAITNPLVVPIRGWYPGYEAPVYIAWSGQNRVPYPDTGKPGEQGRG